MTIQQDFNNNSIFDVSKNKCFGCGSCLNACPNKAITKEYDAKGFFYPKIDFDRCVNCGVCRKVCPSIKTIDTSTSKLAYGAINNDFSLQMNSSSSGIFTIVADHILENGGVVVGCVWDDKKTVKHIIVDNKRDLRNLRGSKYVQSDISKLFNPIKNLLDENRIVLFTGVPCQIAAIKAFLKRPYDNIYYIDLVCHGVPSSKMLNSFILWYEKKHKTSIDRIDFRYKTIKNGQYLTKIVCSKNTKRKKTRILYWQETFFMFLFMNGYGLRDSCYECKFCSRQRCGDITLGDFWGVEDSLPLLKNEYGVSLVLVNNDKGRYLLNVIKNRAKLYAVDVDKSTSSNDQLNHPCHTPSDNTILEQYIEDGDYSRINSFYNQKFKKRIKTRFVFLLHKLLPKSFFKLLRKNRVTSSKL